MTCALVLLARRWALAFKVRAGVSTLLLLALCGCGETPETWAPNSPKPYNVILVTLDGVRWVEFFAGSDPMLTPNATKLFPLFHQKLEARGQAYGDPASNSVMTVGNSANASLPGYMSLFAEREQSCLTNYCKRTTVPTFLDRLNDELGFNASDVAVFASWSKVRRAVTGRDDVATIQTGGFDLSGETTHPDRELLDDAFETDRGTVLNGFAYLREVRPRFLYLSFLDSDRRGHQKRYDEYVATLNAYDRLLGALIDRLDAAGDYGRKTALVVTTDHGRGVWDQWNEHGPQIPASADVWAFVMLPPDSAEFSLVRRDARTFSHHDVRYTIETLFGLGTRSGCGFSTGFIDSSTSQ